MHRRSCLLLCSLLLPFLVAHLVAAAEHYSRADFPADFVFGSGTSAYQYEGAAFEDGRTPSIWDTFDHSGRTNGANGDVACDGYHKYKEDIKRMSDMGLEAFRFSISWSRLIPNGRGPVNQKGLQYYNNFINELISHGIQPHVTLHHFDLPQGLVDEYGGWLNRKIVKDFTTYADVCFREFGDRVLFWTTVNEPNVFALGGYSAGFIAPGRCSPAFSPLCVGNSSTEPYIVAHNIVLAHAATWRLYTEKYKAVQKGNVGLNIFSWGIVPFTNSKEDVIAAKRAKDFYIGWLIDPLFFGKYPETMEKRVKERLPAFTRNESKLVKGSIDFIGVNHYTTISVQDNPNIPDTERWDYSTDLGVTIRSAASAYNTLPYQFPVLDWGLPMTLEYLKQVYGNPPIYIHENGQVMQRNGTLDDTPRIEYLHAYIGSLLDAIRNGSNTKGYFTWSLLDCLELLDGYESGYGFYYVDLDDKELKRYQKLSGRWYSSFLNGKNTKSISIGKIEENIVVSS